MADAIDTDLAHLHLALRLRQLNRRLGAAVRRQALLTARLARPDIVSLCVTDEQVQALLGDADALFAPDGASAAEQSETPAPDQAREITLRAAAAAAGSELPLDALARLHQLSRFEQDALLLCAAPEIDRCYERIYGYVLDDLNRRNPCVELLCMLGGATLRERLALRRALGPYGALRRTGMLRLGGEAVNELRQELRLGAGMLACLCGSAPATAFVDADAIDCGDLADAGAVDARLTALGQALRDGRIGLVGIWGPLRAGHAEAVQQVARGAGMPLRCFTPRADGMDAIRAALDTAAALGALLWLQVDAVASDAHGALAERLAAMLAHATTPVLLTASTPWRPAPLLAARAYAELSIAVPDFDARRALWQQALPGAATQLLDDLAGRYRVGATEVRAAALTARGAAHLAAGGDAVNASASAVAQHIDAACAAVLRPASQRYATVIEARRGPDDLILPPALHAQVLEVVAFFRAWPKVAERWGFGRLMTGRGGVKALFSGDSGTGKTLAAEVVAGALGMPLLKIDLSQTVSKWIGETEKNLEAVFAEAEGSHGVLFFDEADALFGKRGEVQHGVDRYANMEVSYLLQRIEDYAGLVILASNLKDNIDSAFMRRFQVVIQFPRPQPAERRRIWQIAFPGEPLADDIDFDVLARLDMTGAAITASARTAALMAVADGRDKVRRDDVLRAIARQYQIEARVLNPAELGIYRGELKAVS